MSRILITGAAGFIGANLTREALFRGNEVTALVSPTSNHWRLADLGDAVKIVPCDITDAAVVKESLRTARPDYVYHCATYGGYRNQCDPQTTFRVNVSGTWNLIQACKEYSPKLLVSLGTSSEYGRKQQAMRETDTLAPESTYAATKACQALLLADAARGGLPTVTLRPFSVYGPWESPGRLMPTLLKAVGSGSEVKMVSSDAVHDFVYIDDLVSICLDVDASLEKASGQALNVGTGTQTSLGELVNVLESLTGKKVHALWNQMPAQTHDTTVWVADVARLRQVTGHTPQTTVRAGLELMRYWFASHREHYR